MSSHYVRRHLYPVKVAVALFIASIALYMFFSIWPLAFSVYVAFTDANDRNIIEPPRLRELRELRSAIVQNVTSIRDSILAKLQEVRVCVESLRSLLQDLYNNLDTYLESLERVSAIRGALRSNVLWLSANVTVSGLYLDRVPELRDNATSVVKDVNEKIVNTLESYLFFGSTKEVVSRELMESIPPILCRLDCLDKTIEVYESDFDKFVERVVVDIDAEIDKLTLHFVGLSNLAKLFSDPAYLYAILKTLLFVATSVPLKMALGVALAFFFSSNLIIGRKVLRTLLLTPWAIPILLSVPTWRTMFAPGGIVTSTIAPWMNIYAREWDAFLLYNIVEMWLAYPFVMTVTMGAIAGIPKELVESAYIDGAGTWTRFRRILLPLTIRPIAFAAIMTTGASIQAFMIPLLINNGSPYGSIELFGMSGTGYRNDVLLLYAYKQAYWYREYGLSAAAYLLAVVIILIYAIAWYKIFYKRG